jgi:AraC-like DNA-binding protein
VIVDGEWTFAVVTETQRFVCNAVMEGVLDDGPGHARELRERIADPPDPIASRFLRATLLELALHWGYEQHRRLRHKCRETPCALLALADSPARWTGRSARSVDLFVAHVQAIRDELASTHGPSLAQRAAVLITANSGSVSFESTARALGAHPSTLRRAFQREFGMTAREYLTRARIQKAEAMLIEGRDAKVEPIAMAVGWSSKRGLYRAFKQFRGETPGRARLIPTPFSN